VSTDVTYGDNDTLDGGAGNDILIGGQGSDLLYGNLSEDLLFGGAAAVTLVGDRVQRLETDLHDLVASALFGSFNALPGTGDGARVFASLLQNLPGYVTDVTDPLSPKLRPEPLLDVSVFRNLFSLGESSQTMHIGAVSMFLKLFNSGVVTQSPAPAHSVMLEPGSGEPTGQAGGEPDPAEEAQAALSYAPLVIGNSDDGGGDVLVAALGVAGMLAVQQPQSRGRKPLDWESMTDAVGSVLPLMRKALDLITRV
jgi:hypothetical protein